MNETLTVIPLNTEWVGNATRNFDIFIFDMYYVCVTEIIRDVTMYRVLVFLVHQKRFWSRYKSTLRSCSARKSIFSVLYRGRIYNILYVFWIHFLLALNLYAVLAFDLRQKYILSRCELTFNRIMVECVPYQQCNAFFLITYHFIYVE